jgi:hypothetical protein
MGYDVTLSARLANGTILQGGLNAQRRVYDTCNATILSGTTTPNQVDNPEARFCHQELPSRPDFKMLATFNLPLAMIVSGTYQISSGPMITATWAAPNSLIAAPSALGRNLAAGAGATKSIQLIEPGSLYAGYQNQLDLRLSRRLSFGRYRVRADVNLYNAFNNAYANSINTTFSTTASNQFLRPTAVLAGRLFKIGGQVDF